MVLGAAQGSAKFNTSVFWLEQAKSGAGRKKKKFHENNQSHLMISEKGEKGV